MGATAAAAAGGVSFTSTVTAQGEASERFLEEAVRSEKTQSITDELGRIDLRGADSVVVEHTDDETGNVVVRQGFFFLSSGVLIYSETGKGVSDALFKFGADRSLISNFTAGESTEGADFGMGWDLSETSSDRDTGTENLLKEKYRSLPEGTAPMVLGTETEAIFRRNATEAEREIVDGSVPFDITEEVDVITGSDMDGFAATRYVEAGREGTLGGEAETNGDTDRDITHVTPDSADFSPFRTTEDSISARDLSVSSDSGVETASHTVPECAGICTGCAGSITACGLCAPACANPVGPLTCPLCLFGVCHGVLVAGCAFCAKCLDEHYF